MTRVSKFATKTDLVRAGKIIGGLKRVESKDGKTLTLTVKLTTAKGELENDAAVYDKQ